MNAQSSVDPNVCFGKPCIRATRIWVSLILDFLANKMTIEEILEEYPQLTADDVYACDCLWCRDDERTLCRDSNEDCCVKFKLEKISVRALNTNPIIVDFRINETLQIGAVENSTYQTWGAKVSIYFLNSL